LSGLNSEHDLEAIEDWVDDGPGIAKTQTAGTVG
jgi:hypothetical protein